VQITTNQTTRYRSAIPIQNCTHKEYYRVLDMVLRKYNRAGFHIKTIHCNGKFCKMMEKVKDDLGVPMNFTNALDHVPEAKRNNRTIKERVRGAYHQLPYKALGRQFIWYLVTKQASKLIYSQPKEEFHQRRNFTVLQPENHYGLPPLDCDKHCAMPFGAYVQANQETNQTHSYAARTIDTIYLQPELNMQGGHELNDLNSNPVITQARVSQIPVTDAEIKAIETIAKDQGFKSLKLMSVRALSFTMLIGLQEWIMMKTSNKMQMTTRPTKTMRTKNKKKK
jgi:hypothetical protein